MLSQSCHPFQDSPQNKLCITSIQVTPQRLQVLSKVSKSQLQLSQPVSVRPSCQWALKSMPTYFSTKSTSTVLKFGWSTQAGPEADTESERESHSLILNKSLTLSTTEESTILNSKLFPFLTFSILRQSRELTLRFLTLKTHGPIRMNIKLLSEK